MVEQITTLVELLNLLSLDHRLNLNQGNEPLLRLRALRQAGAEGKNNELLTAMSTLEPAELFRVFAALSLRPEQLTPDQISRLHDFLLNDHSISLRTAVARQLRLATQPVVVNSLLDALIRCEDPQLRGVIAYALAENSVTNWQGKVDQMLLVLQQHRYYREHLDCAALVVAIRPLANDLAINRYLLTDYLIKKAAALTDDFERIAGILAGLIIESVGQNLNRANQRLDEYEQGQNEPVPALALLRSEMNNLLTPTEREAQLEKTFARPLREATEAVRSIWEASLKNTEKTLQTRRRVGGFGFTVGIIIMFIAVILIGFMGTEGYWVALLGIVTLTITAVYSGPVRAYKQILTEIGTANAVYTAYTQRTLEISNAYMHLYLHNQLTQDALEKSNELIGKTMKETVAALRSDGKVSFDDFLAQFDAN